MDFVTVRSCIWLGDVGCLGGERGRRGGRLTLLRRRLSFERTYVYVRCESLARGLLSWYYVLGALLGVGKRAIDVLDKGYVLRSLQNSQGRRGGQCCDGGGEEPRGWASQRKSWVVGSQGGLLGRRVFAQYVFIEACCMQALRLVWGRTGDSGS